MPLKLDRHRFGGLFFSRTCMAWFTNERNERGELE